MWSLLKKSKIGCQEQIIDDGIIFCRSASNSKDAKDKKIHIDLWQNSQNSEKYNLLLNIGTSWHNVLSVPVCDSASIPIMGVHGKASQNEFTSRL